MLMLMKSLATVQTNLTTETAKKNTIIKLQRDTSRQSNKKYKKRNDFPYIFRHILYIRTRSTQ